jgi:arsenate reductase
MKVLILCTGNSCRSQMAHGFLKSFDERIIVRSAGTEPAKQVNSKAIAVMREVGIDISRHIPVNVDKFIAEEWDYVITVCDHVRETCPAFLGKVKHRIHIGFEDPSLAIGSENYIWSEFRRVRDKIRENFYRFYLEQIRPQV